MHVIPVSRVIPCGASLWQGKSPPFPGVHVNQETGAGQHLSALGLSTNLWKDSTLDSPGADPMLVMFVNQSFLQCFKPWLGVQALAALLLSAASNRPWVGETASVVALSERE